MGLTVCLVYVAVWEYQTRHQGQLPIGEESLGELTEIAEDLRKTWQVNEKFMKEPPQDVLSYVALQKLRSCAID
jgi:hypothetical protein